MQTATSNLLARITTCPTVENSTVMLTNGLGTLIEAFDGDQPKLAQLSNDLLQNSIEWAGAVVANTPQAAAQGEHANGQPAGSSYDQAVGNNAAFGEKTLEASAEAEEADLLPARGRRKNARSAASADASSDNASVASETAAPPTSGRKARQKQAA